MSHRGVWKALRVVRVSIISRGWTARERGSWSNRAESNSKMLLVKPEKLRTSCSSLLSAPEQGTKRPAALVTVLWEVSFNLFFSSFHWMYFHVNKLTSCHAMFSGKSWAHRFGFAFKCCSLEVSSCLSVLDPCVYLCFLYFLCSRL